MKPGGIVGNAGGPYKTLDGAMNVHTADVHTIPVNEFFKFITAVSSTLASAASSQDRDLILVDATGFVVGNTIQIGDGNNNACYPTIISIATNTLTLDRLIDADAVLGEIITVVNINMKVAGSAGSPIIFVLKPPSGRIWHITRMLPTMTHSLSGNLGLFGSIAILTNGVIIRAKVNGQYGTFTNWKSNADMKKDMFDLEFDARTGPGDFGTSGRGSFSRIGVAIRLDGDVGDQIEAMVQDDLTGLVNFNLNGQGHIEGQAA